MRGLEHGQGGHEPPLRRHGGQEGRPRRTKQRPEARAGQRDQIDHPYRPRERQECHQPGPGQVAHDHHCAPVQAIGQDACERPEREPGDGAQGQGHADRGRAPRELVHVHGERDERDERAGVRDPIGQPERSQLAVAEHPEQGRGATNDGTRHRSRLSRRQGRAMSRTAVSSTSVAAMARYANAWYCEGLGLGRFPGLHLRHTDCPQGTVWPHRMHRSYSRFTAGASFAVSPLAAHVDEPAHRRDRRHHASDRQQPGPDDGSQRESDGPQGEDERPDGRAHVRLR